ncbi:unnamed protein product [Caenorhabditis sp. 36 PRJEB53466]|nr:unnamed protein product [Caenorhabditis sp. 36 PRJEB53466]
MRSLSSQPFSLKKKKKKKKKYRHLTFQGYSPEYCAQLIANAIRDRKTDYIMAHADARFAVFLRYWWPTLMNYVLYLRGTKDQWAPKNKNN